MLFTNFFLQNTGLLDPYLNFIPVFFSREVLSDIKTETS